MLRFQGGEQKLVDGEKKLVRGISHVKDDVKDGIHHLGESTGRCIASSSSSMRLLLQRIINY